ncbi:hypothetical protein Pint_26299 [Pistacia integerrima]|uniref:Uncharacterized protein n=1 Tax=Pistacia integerrima TaxID=434235 RepID=A0ACC0YF66_9ROSI|nr:hypothetical protein Pint_26299 [Pistacia integerrima]
MTMALYSRPSVCICFPGTEIPQWFNYISTGSSINIQLPSSWFNPDFVGFIICVVVEFRNYLDKGHGLVIHYDCKLSGKNDMPVLYRDTLKGWYYGIGPHYIDSNHIFLGYDSNMLSSIINKWDFPSYNELDIQFCVEDLDNKRIDCCKVLKCGVSSVYSPETRKPLKAAIWEKLPCEKLDDEEDKLPHKKQNVASL